MRLKGVAVSIEAELVDRMEACIGKSSYKSRSEWMAEAVRHECERQEALRALEHLTEGITDGKETS